MVLDPTDPRTELSTKLLANRVWILLEYLYSELVRITGNTLLYVAYISAA